MVKLKKVKKEEGGAVDKPGFPLDHADSTSSVLSQESRSRRGSTALFAKDGLPEQPANPFAQLKKVKAGGNGLEKSDSSASIKKLELNKGKAEENSDGAFKVQLKKVVKKEVKETTVSVKEKNGTTSGINTEFKMEKRERTTLQKYEKTDSNGSKKEVVRVMCVRPPCFLLNFLSSMFTSSHLYSYFPFSTVTFSPLL